MTGTPWASRARKRAGDPARREALQKIAEQVEAGTLVVRKATADERERYGISAVAPDEDEEVMADAG